MSTRRKTIEVATVLEIANGMLANSAPEARSEREALCVMTEAILHAANAYRGYRYLASEYLPAAEQTDTNVLRPDMDESRRAYYGPPR